MGSGMPFFMWGMKAATSCEEPDLPSIGFDSFFAVLFMPPIGLNPSIVDDCLDGNQAFAVAWCYATIGCTSNVSSIGGKSLVPSRLSSPESSSPSILNGFRITNFVWARGFSFFKFLEKNF